VSQASVIAHVAWADIVDKQSTSSARPLSTCRFDEQPDWHDKTEVNVCVTANDCVSEAVPPIRPMIIFVAELVAETPDRHWTSARRLCITCTVDWVLVVHVHVQDMLILHFNVHAHTDTHDTLDCAVFMHDTVLLTLHVAVILV